jgi:hypothetical protein
MFDHRFFASKTGLSAMISVAAMVTFNLYAASLQAPAPADLSVGHNFVTVKSAELA